MEKNNTTYSYYIPTKSALIFNPLVKITFILVDLIIYLFNLPTMTW